MDSVHFATNTVIFYLRLFEVYCCIHTTFKYGSRWIRLNAIDFNPYSEVNGDIDDVKAANLGVR